MLSILAGRCVDVLKHAIVFEQSTRLLKFLDRRGVLVVLHAMIRKLQRTHTCGKARLQLYIKLRDRLPEVDSGLRLSIFCSLFRLELALDSRGSAESESRYLPDILHLEFGNNISDPGQFILLDFVGQLEFVVLVFQGKASVALFASFGLYTNKFRVVDSPEIFRI